MRINKYLAQATGMSRRSADTAIAEGRVTVNGWKPSAGHSVLPNDKVTLDGKHLAVDGAHNVPLTIMLHKPAGYVVSRNGQGSQTIYDLLPATLSHLKPIGRLDKDSSGLLLLSNDGSLANRLTHPSYGKIKVYQIRLDASLAPLHRQMISDYGVQLEDGPSKLQLERLEDGNDSAWQVTMQEGRNRQIRRTFAALGYTVTSLHRIGFGEYMLGDILAGEYTVIKVNQP